MNSKNLALYIESAGAPFTLGRADIYEPGPADVLVKNTSIALNPFEHRIQQTGAFINSYPNITGYSFAGTVEKVGSLVTTMKPGDRVVAFRRISDMNLGNQYGVYQKYALIKDGAVAKLDHTTSLDHASALGNLLTVVGALNVCMGMDRPPLSAGTVVRKNKKILVYGGSSSLGMLTAEYAMRAGYDVVTTSSPKNMDEVRRFCPEDPIVDHTLPRESLIEELAAHGPYDYVFDAITTQDTKLILANVVKRSGGGVIWGVRNVTGPDPDIPEGVEVKGASYPPLVEKDEAFSKWFFSEFLPYGLSSKTITAPKIEKVPKGLVGLPEALERLGTGKVSGAKLVVNPWETEH